MHPGALDEYGDGQDQDCDLCPEGVSGDGVDRDCDGFPANVLVTGEYGELIDCNDGRPDVYPGSEDMAGDGLDADCDGVDGVDGDGDGIASVASGGLDCDDQDPLVSPLRDEVCANAADDDCDGTADNADADLDGWIAVECGGEDCDDNDDSRRPLAPEDCDGVDDDCNEIVDDKDLDLDGYLDLSCGFDDCNDENPIVYPGAQEFEDALDNDCDGIVDNGTPSQDTDGDGFAPVHGDCDDADPTVYPGAPKDGGTGLGTGNGVDDDCDGFVDDGTLDYDDDGDGVTETEGDCDDANAAVSPLATELCNGADDDCNTIIDDRDIDGDGAIAVACGGDDCDDLRPQTNPSASETPDLMDNDCDGVVDEGTVLYDDDGDGFEETAGDCDDGDAGVYPGAAEVCGDALDNDCDGVADNLDADGDGFRPLACGGLDCDDSSAVVGPITIDSGEGPGTLVEGFTLQHGDGGSAGGIFVSGASPTLRHLWILKSYGDTNAGGIYLGGGNGGGLYFGSGVLSPMTVSGMAMSNNTDFGVTSAGSVDPTFEYSNVYGSAFGDYTGMTDPTGTNGNLSVSPQFVMMTSQLVSDLHLGASSPSVNAGPLSENDPDGTRADMGAYGGPDADLWDLDWDGSPGWWQPGPYDGTAYPPLGWDCDDENASVHSETGC